MGGCKWVRRSLRHLSDDLHQQGHRASPKTVARLLRKQDFSLCANVKRLSGKAPPADRDQQFRHIQRRRDQFITAGLPIISVDAKKKELVGDFKNPGEAWCRQPTPVNTYDFIADAQCRATPYALFDPQRNRGMVAVGTSADTARFASDCIERWWQQEGRQVYPQADQLLILADGGGSNGHRSRLWKSSLQEFSNRSGLALTVCHYPTGASKWNPVEHKLLSQISINWAATPLRSLGTMLACIRGTTTRTGLRVKAWLNTKLYPTRVKIPDAQMRSLNLRRLPTCPAWSYTISPLSDSPSP